MVAAATHAVVFRARPNQFKIPAGREHARYCGEEARPARAAVKLHRRGEERQTAASADEHPGPLFLVQGASEGALGAFPTQHIELLGRETLLPLRFRALQGLGGEHRVCTVCQVLLPVLLQFFQTHCHSRTLCSASWPRQRNNEGRDRQTFEQYAPFHKASVVAANVLPNCTIFTYSSQRIASRGSDSA